jgi:tetratricopeptide (TPR) repeat protein
MERLQNADAGASTRANAGVDGDGAVDRMERLQNADAGASIRTKSHSSVHDAAIQAKAFTAKAIAADEITVADHLSAELRRLAFSAFPLHIGVSVQALSDHAKAIDGLGAINDSSAFVEVLSSNEVGPAEFYVIHDLTVPFSATISSLLTFFSSTPNGLQTFLWIDVVCMPRAARKTRSMLNDMRTTMAEIGKVIICTESFTRFSVIKQSWCLYQIHVASSIGCRLMVVSNDVPGIECLLLDDSSWDNVRTSFQLYISVLCLSFTFTAQMLKHIDFGTSVSGDESEKMELLRDCGMTNATVFNNCVRMALDNWYVNELLKTISLDANQNVSEELLSKISQLAIISRVYINRKQFSKARPICVECSRCATQLVSSSSSVSESGVTDSTMANQTLVFEAASRLALVFDGLEEFDAARSIHNEILDMSVKLYGEKNEHTLHSQHCYASHLRLSGSSQAALAVAESVLRIRESSSKESLDVAESAELMAFIHEDLNQLDEALSFHQRALDIRLQSLTSDHKSTWSSMISIAQLMLKQNTPDRAEVILRQVYQSTSRVLGDFDMMTLLAAEKLAVCLSIMHLNVEALTIFLRILHGHRSIVSTDNAEVVNSLKNVAATYCSLGKLQVVVMLNCIILYFHRHFRMDLRLTISLYQPVRKFTELSTRSRLPFRDKLLQSALNYIFTVKR